MKIAEIRADRLDDAAASAAAEALSETGAVLLRLEEASLEGFEDFSRGLCGEFHEVGTRTKLRKAEGDGFTTEVFRKNFILLGHCEGMYRPWPPPPDLCFFLCRTPPSAGGGETIIVDGAEMLAALPSALAAKLGQEGVIYSGLWEQGRWQAEFGVGDRSDVEQLLSSVETFTFSWTGEAGDSLQWRYRARALGTSNEGALVFANAILAHLPSIDHLRYKDLPVYVNERNGVSFGNGDPIGSDDIEKLIDAHDAVAHLHRWRENDIVVLDNRRFMHGRLMTNAPCERVLISRFGRLGPAQRTSV